MPSPIDESEYLKRYQRVGKIARSRGFVLRKKKALAGRQNFGRYRLDTVSKPVRIVCGFVDYRATFEEIEAYLDTVLYVDGRWIDGPKKRKEARQGQIKADDAAPPSA